MIIPIDLRPYVVLHSRALEKSTLVRQTLISHEHCVNFAGLVSQQNMQAERSINRICTMFTEGQPRPNKAVKANCLIIRC